MYPKPYRRAAGLDDDELAWMAENAEAIEAEQAAREQIVSIYVHPSGARAVCRGGVCAEITGVPAPTGLDNYDLEPQVGWRAGQLLRIGFVKQQ